MKIKVINIKRISASGFTLLEVLVALAIFALVSVTCYRQVDAGFRSLTRVEEKYLALWIAENKLEEMFVERKLPLMGETRSEYEISGSPWLIKMNVSETEIKNLRRVDVSVHPDAKGTDNAVLTLTRFVGEN